jgi:hypothetical protein
LRWLSVPPHHGARREQLAGDLDILSRQAFDLAQNAGHVATWSGIARDQAQAHGIIQDRSDNRYGCGRLRCRKRRRQIEGDNEVGL